MEAPKFRRSNNYQYPQKRGLKCNMLFVLFVSELVGIPNSTPDLVNSWPVHACTSGVMSDLRCMCLSLIVESPNGFIILEYAAELDLCMVCI